MMPSESLPLADLKNRLSEVIDRVEREQGRVVITKHGRPAAILVSVDDLVGLEETLQLMSDPELVADYREATAEIERGDAVRLTKAEVLERIGRS